MTLDEKIALRDIVEKMFLLIHTKCEIATLAAKNQNAPKYLYNQAEELQDLILEEIAMMESV